MYQSTILDQLTEQARLIGRVSAPALLTNDRKLPEELVAGFRSTTGCHTRRDLHRQWRSVCGVPRARPARSLAAGSTTTGHQLGIMTLTVSEPIALGARTGSIRIEASLTDLYLHLAWYALVFTLAGVAAVGIACCF